MWLCCVELPASLVVNLPSVHVEGVAGIWGRGQFFRRSPEPDSLVKTWSLSRG
jgi:hypothetical protein